MKLSVNNSSILYALAFILFLPLTAQADYWRGPVSEEYTPKTCDIGDTVTKTRCAGSYCDNNYLYCHDSNYSGIYKREWKNYISEEAGQNVRTCGDGIITGLAAKGKYSDYISVECSYYTNHHTSNCSWTPYVSEEQGTLNYPNNKYATAVQCAGSYCDKERFYVCNY